MKNFKVFAMSLLAAGAFSLASCSSSDELGGDTNKSEVVAGTQYVSVKIVTNSGSGSRAEYEQGSGSYEDGTEAESKISSIRFYLFNEDGSAYKFKSVTTDGNTETTASVAHNWVNITPLMKDNGAVSGETVEAQTEATLIMKGTTTTSPKKIVAVANVVFGKDETDYALDELSKVVADYSASANAGDFVMSNSVYLKDGEVVNYASLDGKVFTEEKKALADGNPATIYIERALAKVNTTLDASKYNDANITKEMVGTLTDGTKVYAKVLGWKVTTEAQTSYLLKNISASWTNSDLYFTDADPWNSADYHRSYWASNPANLQFGYHTYAAIKKHITGALYTQENAANIKDATNATKVIVAAQLVNVGGDAVELCKFGGNEYVGEDNVKKQILATYQNLGYMKKSSDSEYSDLAADDFTLEYLSNNGKEYKLKAVLKSTLQMVNKSDKSSVEVSAINTKMLDYPVTVAKTGYVYYFTEINHLNSKPGVVRNHSYQLNIQDIKGFGTPVYNPESEIEIDPVVPEDDPKTYMAAQCKILSWRIVKSNVNLDKTEKK